MSTTDLTCSECDATYTITSDHNEAIQFCPFCGTEALLPFDDIDDDEIFGELEDEDEFADAF